MKKLIALMLCVGLCESPDGYQYHQIPFNTSAYNWNTFAVD